MARMYKFASTLPIGTYVSGIGLLLAVLTSGCGTVRPEGDYQHAAGLIEVHTGVDDVYDPVAEEIAQERITQLITDGLTLEEAVRVALLNNRAFQAQFLGIGASRADVVQSGLLSNPTLALSVRFPEGGGRAGLGMGLAQEIVDLWQIPVRKKIAKEQLEQVVLGVVQSAIDLRAKVQTTCCELLALQQAEAITNENLDLVERSLKLAQDRFDAGESGLLDVNLARANVLDVKMKLVALHRDITSTRANLSHALGLCTIKSPIDGVVTRLPIRQGMYVVPPAELATIMDLSALFAQVRVPASYLSQVHIDAEATIEVPSLPDGQLSGVIARIGKEAAPRSGDVTAYVSVPNPKGDLRPGLACRVRVALPDVPDAVAVPSASVSECDGVPVLTVIRAEKAYEIEVQLGAQTSDFVQITEGVSEGELVAVEGGYGLPEGCPVSVTAGEECSLPAVRLDVSKSS